MIAPARLAAYRVLRAVNGRRVDLPAALARERADLADERDRALTGEIVTGTLRWQGAFDHVIAALAGRPLSRLDPEVVDVLRLTLFQLWHLDRVPASACVNDAVNLVRAAGKRSAAALVNALLRRASRERRAPPLPARAAHPRDAALDYLSVTLSHPRWLAARWLDRHGFDAAEAWCRFNNAPAPLTLRVNRLRGTRDEVAEQLRAVGVDTRPTRFAPDGLVVELGNPLRSPLADAGLFTVQDEASQLVAIAVGAAAGERVLDACAAPGGKATALATVVGPAGLVVAADVRPRRVRLLADMVRTLGADHIRIVQADAASRLPFFAVFDRVLVDAPCSGLGTLRRDPDIKWRRTGDDELARLARTQVAMLIEAARVVRPGGRLVYATCSSEPEENEEVVARFLAGSPEFASGRVSRDLPAEVVDGRGDLRTDPARHGLEAFFAAVLVKDAGMR
jgi:16S rRNA (cytosine967-C5)-methyltransferase